jgi:hypothetical protein
MPERCPPERRRDDEEADMRAMTAFLVGIGTVGVAITGGLGGGLLIGDAMNPHPPKHDTQTARGAPPPMPAAAALPYAAATLALTDPSVNGSAPAVSSAPAVDQQPAGGRIASQSAQTAATAPAGQPTSAKPSIQETQTPATPNPASTSEDANAKASDADLKHAADRHRMTRAERWAERHHRWRDQDQNQNQGQNQDPSQNQSQNQNQNQNPNNTQTSADQQARDDHKGDRDNGDRKYSENYSDRRYRGDDRSRYRYSRRWYRDDREPRYYVEESRRPDFPRIQLFGPDD